MDYPPQFSTEAQAAVEDEKISADEEFNQRRNGISQQTYGSEYAIARLIYHFIVRVTLTFAREACKLGRSRVLSVSEIDSLVHSFMRQVAIESNLEKTFYENGTDVRGLRLVQGNILPQVLHQLKSTTQWKEYQKELSSVAKIQKRPQSAQRSTPEMLASNLRKLRSEAGLTQARLAELTGINTRTIKRHEASKTGIRDGNLQTYESALSQQLGRPIKL